MMYPIETLLVVGVYAALLSCAYGIYRWQKRKEWDAQTKQLDAWYQAQLNAIQQRYDREVLRDELPWEVT